MAEPPAGPSPAVGGEVDRGRTMRLVRRAVIRARGWTRPELASPRDVKACYRILLGRDPDPGGWRVYHHLLGARQVPRAELIGYFMESQEFRERMQESMFWAGGDLEEVKVGHMRLFVRDDDHAVGLALRESHAYEPKVTRAMQAVLRPGATFVDVGASLGYFTVLAGLAVGESGAVHAFEPGPQNLSLLLLNVFANDLHNVVVHQVAVSDRSEILTYGRAGSNGVIGPFDGEVSALNARDLVQAVRLDDVLAPLERVDVMKVDVEGAEGRALAGAAGTLRRHRPIIFFEFTPDALATVSGVTAEAFLASIAELGYGFAIPAADDDGGPALAAGDVLRAYVRGGAGHLDVLAAPLEHFSGR